MISSSFTMDIEYGHGQVSELYENNFFSKHPPKQGVSGSTGDLDKITLSNSDLISESKGTPWKYNEEEIVRELLEYIRGTYGQHYAANDENIQTLDFIEAAHKDGEPFCRDNILKYVSRYDKKGTPDRDIMKIMHYAVLLKFFYSKNKNRETYPQ